MYYIAKYSLQHEDVIKNIPRHIKPVSFCCMKAHTKNTLEGCTHRRKQFEEGFCKRYGNKGNQIT